MAGVPASLGASLLVCSSPISRLTSTIPFATLLQQMGGTKRVLGSQSQLSLSKQTTNNSHSWKSASVVVVFPFAFGSLC